MATPLVAEQINTYGIKIDIIIADAIEESLQSDVKLIAQDNDSPLVVGMMCENQPRQRMRRARAHSGLYWQPRQARRRREGPSAVRWQRRLEVGRIRMRPEIGEEE